MNQLKIIVRQNAGYPVAAFLDGRALIPAEADGRQTVFEEAADFSPHHLTLRQTGRAREKSWRAFTDRPARGARLLYVQTACVFTLHRDAELTFAVHTDRQKNDFGKNADTFAFSLESHSNVRFSETPHPLPMPPEAQRRWQRVQSLAVFVDALPFLLAAVLMGPAGIAAGVTAGGPLGSSLIIAGWVIGGAMAGWFLIRYLWSLFRLRRAHRRAGQ